MSSRRVKAIHRAARDDIGDLVTRRPLPGPGVLSSGNSIGTPALLPDGTISTESVMASTPGGTRELPALESPEES